MPTTPAKTKKVAKKQSVAITLDPTMHERLVKQAQVEERTVTTVVTRAIRLYLDGGAAIGRGPGSITPIVPPSEANGWTPDFVDDPALNNE